jgi:methylglutaconyl-CoA hydratase
MPYALLTLDIDKRGIASIGLNRPEVHNAFDPALIAEVTHVFEQLDNDTNVRFAIIYGHGPSFCAGGDLNWMRSMKSYCREENIADGKKLAEMYSRIRSFSKPLIGIVHGAALGGGSGIAAVCDFVVATEDAKFGFTETRLGILPAVIGPYAIEKIGLSAARAYFTSGMQFPATTAKEIGLVHRVVGREKLNIAREEIICEFLKAAPQACRKAKAQIDTIIALSSNPEAVTDACVNAIADARISDEGQEGMDALLTKRKPKWNV